MDGLIIAPPTIFLEEVKKNIQKAELGSQDLFWEEKGAFTGEVSASELKSLGVGYAIIGHSERRKLGETDEMVAKKIKAAAGAGLTPILCVGESAAERAAGKTEEVVARELKISLSLIGNWEPASPRRMRGELEIGNLIVAYEPIWAIGTGTPDTPQDMINMVKYIKKILKEFPISNFQFPIIYGGSVTSQNAQDFLQHKEIEGVLVGGASLKSEEIKKIVAIARER